MQLGVHRVVIKNRIENEKLYRPIEAGEKIFYNGDYEWLKRNYPDSIVEIPMTDKEWLEYLSREVRKSFDKAMKLQLICERLGLDVQLPISFEERTTSLSLWPDNELYDENRVLDPNNYGGGIDDVVNKAVSYIDDINNYEERVFARIKTNGKRL